MAQILNDSFAFYGAHFFDLTFYRSFFFFRFFFKNASTMLGKHLTAAICV